MQNKPLRSATSDAGPSFAGRAVERTLARRRERYASEVTRLVDAALALIEATGELEPRVSEIVARAGLSNQAFYKHFRSKRELLVAVLDAGIERLATHLAERMGAHADPVERVRAWLEGMTAQALHEKAASATRPFALSRERLATAYPEEVADSERRLTALVRDALLEARASGALPFADPERDAETLHHLAMGWMQSRLRAGDATDPADAERLVRFALAGLARTGEAD